MSNYTDKQTAITNEIGLCKKKIPCNMRYKSFKQILRASEKRSGLERCRC